jgi:RimJ/RimL family protein N-acetyltransferase
MDREGEVRLREVEEADLPTLYEHQLDEEATRMAAFPSRDREAFMAHWARILRDDSGTKRTVLVGDRVVGNVVSWDQDGERLVGYWIGREHWGRGIATRALAAFLLVDTTRPMRAHVARHNRASIRVLEKCGFEVVEERLGPSSAGDDPVAELVVELRGDPPATDPAGPGLSDPSGR